MNKKFLFVDIYQPILEEDLVSYKDVIHLERLDIVVDEDMNRLVDKLKEHLGWDGFYFRIEEFQNRCYINIFIFFEQDIKDLLDYLMSINIEDEEVKGEPSSVEKSEEVVLFSVDYLFSQKDLDELLSFFEEEDIKIEVTVRERSAFERGAEDYHENIVIAFVTGVGQAVGEKIMSVLFSRYDEVHSPRFNEVKSKEVIRYTSEETGINIHDLNIVSTKTSQEDDRITEIKLTSRYKDISVSYNKATKDISYEVFSKFQTGI